MRVRASPAQARCSWQVYNYAEALAAARGRRVVRVNVDETAVCLFPGAGRGNLFVRSSQLLGRRGQRVAKWKQRCFMTHVGVLCDEPVLRRFLPQFIIGNARSLPARRRLALRERCPPTCRSFSS